MDFAQNRYFAAKHGRFTSVDPLAASASAKNPQTLNRYTYALNSPYKFTDPLGLFTWSAALGGPKTDAELEDELERLKRDGDANCNEIARLDQIIQERRRVVAAMDLALERARIFEENGLTDEANRIRSAINAYGKAGQDNGVVVARDLDTADEGGYTHIENGKIIVAFNMEQMNEQNVAHEGVHVLQATRYLTGTNISIHDAEMEAYTVSALVSETNVNISTLAVESGGSDFVIYNRNWLVTGGQDAVRREITTHVESLLSAQGKSPSSKIGLASAFPGGRGRWE